MMSQPPEGAPGAFDIVQAVPDARCDLGTLPPGQAGLLLLERARRDAGASGLLEVVTRHARWVAEMPSWARLHSAEVVAFGDDQTHHRWLLRVLPGPDVRGRPDWGVRLPRRAGGVDLRDWLVGQAGQVAERAEAWWGLVPRGAVAEAGGPLWPFTLARREAVWDGETAGLLEDATRRQWNATTDIAWDSLPALPDDLEWAVCQIMTFLVENELVALYVPAKFLAQIHPHYLEPVLFLASVVYDEARHVEVFTKRALANGGGLQYSSALSAWSLHSLFVQEDYFTASFLLHVLGEGTFLDLLSFVAEWAPDPVTAEVVRRARSDEQRHVAYGIAHVRRVLREASQRVEDLVAAAEARQAYLQAVSGGQPMMTLALAMLAGGGGTPAAVDAGLPTVHALYAEMHRRRVGRLQQVGLPESVAEHLSRLHTPNFM
ncbi:MAG: ferritin-like domain-containing protein [Firmicutes bacterium]|nr:ferritin-like domain-containing protein [Alicyclobacillaceae bacterium]MCL6497770.1 ferritin-like domain-containing protein [Bacillota bacterium]